MFLRFILNELFFRCCETQEVTVRVLVQEKVPAGSYTPLAEEIVQVKYPLTEAYALKAAHAAHLSFS